MIWVTKNRKQSIVLNVKENYRKDGDGMTETEGIAAAKAELESYLRAVKDAASIWRRYTNLWARQGSISAAPTVPNRRGYSLQPILAEDGTPTGKRKRAPSLVPCPISVQTQRNPHREEELFAEVDYLGHAYSEKIEESRALAAKIETRILALNSTHSEILYMRYIEGLRLDQIVRREDWFYSYRQIIRKVEDAVAEYARIYQIVK